MSLICLKCKTENIDSAKFCRHCGSTLTTAYFQEAMSSKDLSDIEKTADKIITQHDDYFVNYIIVTVAIVIIFIAFSYVLNHKNSDTPLESVPSTEVVEMNATPETVDTVTPKVNSITADDTSNVKSGQRKLDTVDYNEKAFKCKNKQKKIEYFTKAIKSSSNNGVYHDNKGVVHYEKGIYYNNRGFTYYEIGNIKKAKEDAKKACRLGHCELKKFLSSVNNNVVPEVNQAPVNETIDGNQPIKMLPTE